MNEYYNMYEKFFQKNGENYVAVNIFIPNKSSDKNIVYKQGQSRLDVISNDFYNSPFFRFLIFSANPTLPSNEFEIPDNTNIRIPFPLTTSLQDWENSVIQYRKIYGI